MSQLLPSREDLIILLCQPCGAQPLYRGCVYVHPAQDEMDVPVSLTEGDGHEQPTLNL
jgi:hypothetical protein